jgi:exopolysaccharide production protein ExoF
VEHKAHLSVQNDAFVMTTARMWGPSAFVAASLLLITILAGGPARAQDTGSEAYRLGAGDQIELRVVLWAEEVRRYEAWSAISGAYTVQPDGTLHLPVGGSISVDGRILDDVSNSISHALQAQIGSVESPGVAIEVTAHRPFFVLGQVNAPGAFPAQPGLTVLQAFALAGGARVTSAVNGNALSSLRDSGSLRQTRIDMTRGHIRAARLRAEIAGDGEIAFSDKVTHPDGADALAAAQAEETAVFESRATAFSLEVANLDELKLLLSTEIASLEEKSNRLGEQVELARTELARINQLRESGLVAVTQQTNAQRQLFDLESQELDLQTAMFRSRQRMKEADRDLLALRTKRVSDNAAELQNVAADLEQMQARLQTLRALVAEAGGAALDVTGQMPETEFRLTPAGGTAADEIVVGPERRIAPGDTLRIVQRLTLD